MDVINFESAIIEKNIADLEVLQTLVMEADDIVGVLIDIDSMSQREFEALRITLERLETITFDVNDAGFQQYGYGSFASLIVEMDDILRQLRQYAKKSKQVPVNIKFFEDNVIAFPGMKREVLVEEPVVIEEKTSPIEENMVCDFRQPTKMNTWSFGKVLIWTVFSAVTWSCIISYFV